MTTRTVAIISGGLDSTTLLYELQTSGHEVAALAVNYGQRHRRELLCAKAICHGINVELTTLELPELAQVFGSNGLSDANATVPTGSYEQNSMQQTTVPNRNMILLSLATGWAISNDFQAVAFGAHSGEYTPYPDCRPEFAAAMDEATQLCDWQPIRILAPFVSWSKSDIVRRGSELDVPFEETWSCYVGGEKHCGRCGTCFDRKLAFEKSGIKDPTIYETE